MQVRNLRERLEEEHQALLKRDADKAGLEVRLMRLTKLILHSTRTHTVQAARKRQRNDLLRCFSAHEKAVRMILRKRPHCCCVHVNTSSFSCWPPQLLFVTMGFCCLVAGLCSWWFI